MKKNLNLNCECAKTTTISDSAFWFPFENSGSGKENSKTKRIFLVIENLMIKTFAQRSVLLEEVFPWAHTFFDWGFVLLGFGSLDERIAQPHPCQPYSFISINQSLAFDHFDYVVKSNSPLYPNIAELLSRPTKLCSWWLSSCVHACVAKGFTGPTSVVAKGIFRPVHALCLRLRLIPQTLWPSEAIGKWCSQPSKEYVLSFQEHAKCLSLHKLCFETRSALMEVGLLGLQYLASGTPRIYGIVHQFSSKMIIFTSNIVK